jgi:hypothetical protein
MGRMSSWDCVPRVDTESVSARVGEGAVVSKFRAEQLNGNATSRSRVSLASWLIRLVGVRNRADDWGFPVDGVSRPQPTPVHFTHETHEPVSDGLWLCRFGRPSRVYAWVAAKTSSPLLDLVPVDFESHATRFALRVKRIRLINLVVNFKVAIGTQQHEPIGVGFDLGNGLIGPPCPTAMWRDVVEMQRAGMAVVAAALTTSAELIDQSRLSVAVGLRSGHPNSFLFRVANVTGIIPYSV